MEEQGNKGCNQLFLSGNEMSEPEPGSNQENGRAVGVD